MFGRGRATRVGCCLRKEAKGGGGLGAAFWDCPVLENNADRKRGAEKKLASVFFAPLLIRQGRFWGGFNAPRLVILIVIANRDDHHCYPQGDEQSEFLWG